jgi:hypothetical protein
MKKSESLSSGRKQDIRSFFSQPGKGKASSASALNTTDTKPDLAVPEEELPLQVSEARYLPFKLANQGVRTRARPTCANIENPCRTTSLMRWHQVSQKVLPALRMILPCCHESVCAVLCS